MAKETKSTSFSKAVITEEDGEFILTEYEKDNTNVYNLTDKLREWVGIEGVSLTLKKDNAIPSQE